MKKVVTMFVFVFVVFLTGCIGATVKAKAEASTTPAAPTPKALSDQGLVILYDCVINTETPDGNKLFTTWCPAAKENMHLPRLLTSAAEFENFSAENVEPFSKGDKDRNYILIYYFEDDLKNDNVTFIRHQWVKNESKDPKAKEKLVKREVTIQKNSDENWLNFYRRGFSFVMSESVTAPKPQGNGNAGKPKAKKDEKPKLVTIFTMEGCAPCEQAKAWFTEQKIEFIEKNVDSDQKEYKDVMGGIGFKDIQIPLAPILKVNGRTLIGWSGYLGEVSKALVSLPPPDDKSLVDRPFFLTLLNAYRKTKELQDVAYNDKLDAAATKWAEHHRDNNIKSVVHIHNGSTPAKRVQEAGYNPSVVAENLARIVSPYMFELFDRWQKSKEYGKNMLAKDAKDIGLDCIEAPAGENLGKYVCVLVLASQKEPKARLVVSEVEE